MTETVWVTDPLVIEELGTENLILQQKIKRVFDPNGILNPGKAI